LWTPIGLQGKQARALLIFDADTMLASTQFDTVSLYRTTDAGATWSSYQNGFGGESSETVSPPKTELATLKIYEEAPRDSCVVLFSRSGISTSLPSLATASPLALGNFPANTR
jgi:phospholipase C